MVARMVAEGGREGAGATMGETMGDDGRVVAGEHSRDCMGVTGSRSIRGGVYGGSAADAPYVKIAPKCPKNGSKTDYQKNFCPFSLNTVEPKIGENDDKRNSGNERSGDR